MKYLKYIMTCMIASALFQAKSQNAPVTTAECLLNPVPGEVVTFPVVVQGFTDIGSLSLTMDYNSSELTFLGAIPNPLLQDIQINGTAIPGRVFTSWFASSGLTLPDGTALFELVFQYITGTTGLIWFTDDAACEYSKFDGGMFNVLNDNPKSLYYVDGLIHINPAPFTFVPYINGTSEGSVTVPVRVNGFNNVTTFSLTLEYDPLVLTYNGNFVAHPLLVAGGSVFTGSIQGPGGMRHLRISWIQHIIPGDPPIVLPDSSVLVSLIFDYPDAMKSSLLKWIDDGISCEYSGTNYEVLPDVPQGTFYRDGAIQGQLSGPVIKVPSTGVLPDMDISLPVITTGFNNIDSFNLTLDYDPAVMTFISASLSNLPATWNFLAGNPETGRLEMSGYGPATTLADFMNLIELVFHYQDGVTELKWNDSDGISCQFHNAASGLPLFDKPQQIHYQDGCIISCNCP